MFRRKNQKGYLIIITVIVAAILFAFALFYVRFFNAEKEIALKNEMELIALTAADAGINDALYYLKDDSGWTAGFDRVTLPHSYAKYSVSFDQGQNFVPYSTNNAAGSVAVTGYNGREVPPGAVHIVSKGEYGKASQIEEAMLLAGSSQLFDSALFVDHNAVLNGNVEIDSYDSSLGTYEETREETGGNIGSNSMTDGTISMMGNVTVHGDVMVGTGGTEDSSVHASGGSSYHEFATSDPRDLPVASVTPGVSLGSVNVNGGSTNLSPATYDSFRVAGKGEVYLEEGVYIFLGDFDMSGQGQLIIPEGEKNVQVYVLGNIKLSGQGIANETGSSANLLFYGGENTENVQISGIAGAQFGLYAPVSDVKIVGNGNLFGGIVADNIQISGNAQLHYDRALGNITNPGGGGGFDIVSRW